MAGGRERERQKTEAVRHIQERGGEWGTERDKERERGKVCERETERKRGRHMDRETETENRGSEEARKRESRRCAAVSAVLLSIPAQQQDLQQERETRETKKETREKTK